MFSYKFDSDFCDFLVVVLVCGFLLNVVFFFFSGRLEINDMCGMNNLLYLVLEVRFFGCYVMMVVDYSLMICVFIMMDKKLIFLWRIYIEIEF